MIQKEKGARTTGSFNSVQLQLIHTARELFFKFKQLLFRFFELHLCQRQILVWNSQQLRD